MVRGREGGGEGGEEGEEGDERNVSYTGGGSYRLKCDDCLCWEGVSMRKS